ncbi:amino acid ABC transporter permease [Arsenicicoccus dermatophilus]|uniref:amino acid ABC transporter permease n=1 Tax=Arsenicicoccus dermatophilus TaxID=1076331 RepID=UPI001F4C8C8F|nr:amino acid ABC transporter permease [Arsenicicoccus dermatophilus]MCH8614273.1 amino acid ABC transporter permease [Arsenicicoccus dermatophilus]
MLDLFREFDILGAFWMTITLTVLSGIGALIIGTILAIFRLSPVPMLRFLGALYVDVVRNTPLTLIAVFCSLGLVAQLGFHLADPRSATFIKDNNIRIGVAALSVYTAAFVCEALRSGVNTVPVGQAEAARSLGLGFRQTLGEIVLPQAFRAALVPLGNTLIALTKNTTVLSVIGVAEISYLQAQVIEDRPDVMFTFFAIVALGFVMLTLPTGLLFTWLSRRLAVHR